MLYQKVKIKYFDYLCFRTPSTCSFYIFRGKASNIDLDGDISNNESINNSDATGDDNDQSESEASGN